MLKKLAPYTRGYRWYILLGVLCSVGEAVLELELPQAMSDIVDVGIASGDRRYIMLMGLKMLVLALLALAGGGAFAYVKFIKPNRRGVKVSADPDEYDFPDEEYVNEDEPAEAETEAEHE